MMISDQKRWDKWRKSNSDAYGKGIMDYAERWANLMEAKIAVGEKLEQIAEKSSQEADIDGITSFMYGIAVSVLAFSWIYGEELRRWHNLDQQMGTEGEIANTEGSVLNPAVMTMKAKK